VKRGGGIKRIPGAKIRRKHNGLDRLPGDFALVVAVSSSAAEHIDFAMVMRLKC
jgi:hypothetical protein